MDNLSGQTNEFHTLFKLAQRQTRVAHEPGKMYADVLPCVRLLSLSGIFPVGGCQKKKRKRPFTCSDLRRRLTGAFLHAYWAYVFFISFLSAVRMSRQFKTNFTLSLGNALVACIRFSVHWKARRLLPVVRSLEAFHLSLAGEGQHKNVQGRITIIYCGTTLAAVGMTVLSVEFLKLSGSFDSFSRDFILGASFPNSSCPFLLHFPPAVFVSILFYHHFVPVTVCVYACAVFHLLRTAVAEFAHSVTREADVGRCASRFGRMTNLVRDVEDLLGAVVFFSFGCLLTNELCVMNSLIAGDTRLPDQPISIAVESMLSLKNFAIFFAITLMGASVSEEIEKVRSEIGRLAVDPPPGADLGQLSLLLQAANGPRTSLTVWKIFALRRSLFLTTTSVLTTYGMLLMQLSQQDRPPDA